MKRTIQVCPGDDGRLVGELRYDQQGHRESVAFAYGGVMCRCLVLMIIAMIAMVAAAETTPDPQLLAALQATVPAGWWVAPAALRPEEDAWPLIAGLRITEPSSGAEPLWSAYLAGTNLRRALSLDQVNLLAGWLDDQREALALVERTASYRGFRHPENGVNDRWASTFRKLSDLLLVDVRVHAVRGDRAAAWAAVAALQRIATFAGAAGTTGIDDLFASLILGRAYKCFARLALESTEPTGLVGALSSLPADRPVDILALLRRAIATPGNVWELAKGAPDGKGWAKILKVNAAIGDRLAATAGVPTEEANHPEIDLIAGQGRVFDAIDSLRLQIAWCDAIAATKPACWSDLQRALDTPDGCALKVRCGAALDFLPSGLDPTRLVRDAKATHEQRAQHQGQMLADFRRILLEDPDPMGEMVAEMQTSLCAKLIELEYANQAHLRLARAAIAVALVRLRDGKLPDSLAAIVAPGLLSDVPLDPFDGAPLRYDAAKGRLWSVGSDMKDDGGDANTDIMVEVMPSGSQSYP